MKKNKLIIALTWLVASVCMSFTSATPPASIEIAIIINASNPVEKLSGELVKNYWLRRFVKRWKENNTGILPVDRKNKCLERDTFYKHILGLPPDDVEAYLSARQYQNGDSPMQKFMSDQEIINYVSQQPGAIGYVNAASVGKDSGVKTILTVIK
jgi:ABC-type phosphate transport system substrate-binding protein